MSPPSSFTRAQEIWIVEQYSKLGRVCDVRRRFRIRIEYKMAPHKVPKDWVFTRVIDRFKKTGTLIPAKSSGRPVDKATEENCERVLNLVEQDHSMSIRQMEVELNLSCTTVWRILRKKLHIFPYKAKTVVPLTV